MQTLVYQTEIREAISEQGVMPEKTMRIYELVLKADTEQDFKTLAEIFQWLKDRARREGAPIIEEEAANSVEKSKAAKNN